jgi:UDP-N-acetylglucosamine--dolichyl-phosphate N-acetylglucosaminephosphotransferase
LEPSKAVFEKQPSLLGRIILEVFQLLGLTRLERAPAPTGGSEPEEKPSSDPQLREGDLVSATNFTLINVLLVRLGPMREPTLCLLVGAVQVAGSAVAFAIRYGVGSLVYGGERR